MPRFVEVLFLNSTTQPSVAPPNTGYDVSSESQRASDPGARLKPPATTRLPAGHDTSAFSSDWPIMWIVLATAFGTISSPLTPAGPAGPVGPTGPCAPVAPGGPMGPTAPSAPA